MNNLEWNENNLSTLGRVFLRNVLDNMRGREESLVRLGETGQGIQPNYQVTFPNGVIRTIRGSLHDAFEHTETEFDSEKVSVAFNLKAVQNAYDRA